jgi:2-keto-3-deoxy-L-rhamnonate aldolase RhmA
MLIEHPGAVEAIDEIFSLDIDFAWVGTHDLAALMGMEPWDPETGEMPSELAKALDRVKRSAAAHDIPFWQPPGKGVPIGIADVDARLVRQAAEQAVAKWKS